MLPQINDPLVDQMLAKNTFFDSLRKEGIVDETLLDQEWRLIVQFFIASCVEEAFKRLPDEDKKILTDGVDLTKQNNLLAVSDKVNQLLLDHPEKVDKAQVLKIAAKRAYDRYMQNVQNR